MSWKFDKVPVWQVMPWDQNPPEGVEWAYRIIRTMPDGQGFVSILLADKDRSETAAMIIEEKAYIRQVTDTDWKPRTTNPDARPGSEGKRDT